MQIRQPDLVLTGHQIKLSLPCWALRFELEFHTCPGELAGARWCRGCCPGTVTPVWAQGLALLPQGSALLCCCLWAHSFSLERSKWNKTHTDSAWRRGNGRSCMIQVQNSLVPGSNYSQCYLIQGMHMYVLSEYFTLLRKFLDVALLPCSFVLQQVDYVFHITEAPKCLGCFSCPWFALCSEHSGCRGLVAWWRCWVVTAVAPYSFTWISLPVEQRNFKRRAGGLTRILNVFFFILFPLLLSPLWKLQTCEFFSMKPSFTFGGTCEGPCSKSQ